jgi:hypothetical protein
MIDTLKHAHCEPTMQHQHQHQHQQSAKKPQRGVSAVARKRMNTARRAVVVKGLRYSIPENISTVTHIKEQFIGAPLSSALSQMWRLQKGKQPLVEAEAYWRAEILAGRVLLCHRRQKLADVLPSWGLVCATTVLRAGDKVKVISHRHERVIASTLPTLLAVSPMSAAAASQFFVFDKPAGVSCCEDPDTVNTLRALASEVAGQRLHIAHRLDQCVTGCIILASSAKAASQARRLMQASKGQTSDTSAGKHYIARVQGKLPTELTSCGRNSWRGLLPIHVRKRTCCSDSGSDNCECDSDKSDEETNAELLWAELDSRPEMKVL